MLIIVQARLGSTRLPGKVMKPFAGKCSVLTFQLERLAYANTSYAVAAPNVKESKKIMSATSGANTDTFMAGIENDVLGRYFAVAIAMEGGTEIVVRITSDCPLIDVSCLEKMKEIFLQKKLDYISNCHPIRYVPSGFDIEMFSLSALEKANYYARTDEEREHVTPWIYHNLKSKSVAVPGAGMNVNVNEKFSIDTKADYEKIRFLGKKLYKKFKFDFDMKDVLDYADKYALELAAIENANKT